MTRIALVSALAALLAACASVPMATPADDAAAKQFTAKPDMASLYVYRNESWGGMETIHVELDGAMLGSTAAETFLFKQLAPGHHTLSSEAENTDTVELDLKAGTLTFVWLQLDLGWMKARARLHVMDPSEGKKGVLECDLAITQ